MATRHRPLFQPRMFMQLEYLTRTSPAQRRRDFWLTYGMLLRVWENCAGLLDTPAYADFHALANGWYWQNKHKQAKRAENQRRFYDRIMPKEANHAQ